MTALYLILLILSGACFLAAAAGANHPRVNLVAAGLLLWVLVYVVSEARLVAR